MNIRTKRIYEGKSAGDGTRILVDRLWPRGISKEKAAIDYWARDVAPSDELRKWYQHEPGKWKRFRARYFKEIDENPAALEQLLPHLEAEMVTLVFSSREEKLNNATALKEFLESRNHRD